MVEFTTELEQLKMLSRHLRHLTEGIMEGYMSPNQISDETHDIRITLDYIIEDLS